jgi:hypothetical protein
MPEAISQATIARALELQRLATEQQNAQRAADAAIAAQEAERTRSRTVGETLSDAGLQTLQGAVGLGQAAYGVGNILTAGTLDRATGFSQNFQQTNEILNAAKSAPTQAQQQEAQRQFDENGALAGVGEYLTHPALLQDLALTNLASVIPAGAAGRFAARTAAEFATAKGIGEVAAKKLVAEESEKAVLRTIGGQTAGAVNVEAINQIRDAGGSEAQQQYGGLGAAAIAGVAAPVVSKLTGAASLEAKAANLLTGATATTAGRGGAVATVLGATAKETAEEGVQSATEQLAQNVFTPDRNLWEGVSQAGALGAVAGGVLGAGAGGVVAVNSPRTSDTSPLGRGVSDMLAKANAALQGVIHPNALSMPAAAPVPPVAPGGPLADVTSDTGPMDVQNIAAADTPLPGERPLSELLPTVEEIPAADAEFAAGEGPLPVAKARLLPVENIMGAPAPLRSLYEITGRLPNVNDTRALPQMGVEELPGAPLTGLNAIVEQQRAIARGEVPTPIPPVVAPEPIPEPAALAQEWKRAVAIELGMKPAALKGAVWEEFVGNAVAEGVRPTAANAGQFLGNTTVKMAKDPATTPLFIALLHEKYQSQATPVEAAPVDDGGFQQVAPPVGVASEAQKTLGLTVTENSLGKIYTTDTGARIGVMEQARYAPRDNSITDFVVPEADRGKGAGTALLDKVLQLYPAETVSAAASSPASVAAFYAKGFRPISQPDATLEQSIAAMREDSSVTMVVPLPPADPRQAAIDLQTDALSSDAATHLAKQLGAKGLAAADATKAREFLKGQHPDDSSAALATLAPIIGIDRTVAAHSNMEPGNTHAENVATAYSESLGDATTTELLDQTFLAIKAHPAWGTLTAEVQASLGAEFDAHYARVGGFAGKFATASAAPELAIPTQSFTRAVISANQNKPAGSPDIIPLESVSDYEVATGEAAPPNAQGVFAGGKIYVIRENIGTLKDLALVVAHERGHHGMAALLGARLTPVTNRLWTNASLRDRIKGKMQYGLTRAVAAEEVLADMLASGETVNGDVITKARSAIETGFAALLGVSHLRMSNAEVELLLRDVAAVTNGASPAGIDQTAKHLRGLVNMMADPAPAVTSDARFSQAAGMVDTSSVAAEQGRRFTVGINNAAMLAGQAGIDAVRNLGSSFKEGGAFSTLLSATPLNQIVNLYGAQFSDASGTPLNDVARLKRRKESSFNKAITQLGPKQYRAGEPSVVTSPMARTKQQEQFQNKNPEAGNTLGVMEQNATLYHLWPDLSWENQSSLDYTNMPFDANERQAELAKIHKQWRAIGVEGQAVFKAGQANYNSLETTRLVALRDELSRATGFAPDSAEFANAFGNHIGSALSRLKTGPYSPLTRYGDYMVTIRDAAGKVVEFSGHDTKTEAEIAAKRAREGAFGDVSAYGVNITARTDVKWSDVGINAAAITQLEQAVDLVLPGDQNATLRNEVSQALVNTYLHSLPQHAFMQHANARKGVAGFTTDTLRVFSDYAIKSARSTSGVKYDGQISTALAQLQSFVTDHARQLGATDTVKMQRVVNAVKQQHQASLGFERSPVTDALSQGGFLFMMTSPSQLFINSMQTLMVTIPRLAGSYTSAPALKAVRGSLSEFVKSKGNMLGERSTLAPGSAELRVLQELEARGVLDFTQAHDVSGLANGESSAMSGHWRTVLEVAGTFMHRSEVFNRQVAALASVRLEMQKAGIGSNATPEQLAKLADVAEDAVLTTQFDYSQANKPTIMQGPWRKLIFQFQQYRVNMLAMMAKDIRDGVLAGTASPEEKATARRALAWMVGTQLAITGVAGSVLAPLAFGLMDMFRDDDDLTDSRTDFLRAMPQWMAHGVLSGAVDTTRLGSSGLIPILGDRAYAPKEATARESFNYYLTRNIGPWAGLLGNAASGVESAFHGDFKAAAKGLMPAPLRDAYAAVYEANSGARDARQITYFEPNVWDTTANLFGLRSGARREVEDVRGSSYAVGLRAQSVKQKYLGLVSVGYATGDQDLIDEGRGKIAAWNDAHPDMAITGADQRRAIVSRARAQINTDLYGIPSSKPPSESLKSALHLDL